MLPHDEDALIPAPNRPKDLLGLLASLNPIEEGFALFDEGLLEARDIVL